MTKKDAGQIIQAMPITAATQVGVVTDLPAGGYSLVHSMADGDITFNFGNTSITVASVAGSDWAIGEGCQTISSTAEVVVS